MNKIRTTRNTETDERTPGNRAEAMSNRTHTVSVPDDAVSHTCIQQAGSYNTNDNHQYSNTGMPSPGVESGYGGDISPRTSNYYEYLYATDEMVDFKYSTTQSAAQQEPRGLSSFESQRVSTMTMFPTMTTFNSSPEPALKRTDSDVVQRKPVGGHKDLVKIQSYFKRVKNFYQEGPPGEGQELWNGLKAYWRERQTGPIFEVCSPTRADKVGDDSLDSKYAKRPLQQQSTTISAMGPNVGQLNPRHDSMISASGISRTSRDVPIKFRRTVLVTDMSKAVPRTQLSDPPRRRPQDGQGKIADLNKPLPRTPFPSFPQPPTHPQEVIDESPVDAPWVPTVGSQLPKTQNIKITLDLQPPKWLQDITTKASDAGMSLADKGKTKSKPSEEEKAHAALKATISRPIPITPTNNLSPTDLPVHIGMMSAKMQGKQKVPSSPTWLNKLPRPTMPFLPNLPTMHKATRRPASDESFACQGLGEGGAHGEYGVEAELTVQDGGPRMRDGDEMKPEPLFTGRMSDGTYYDDDVHANQRGTGRWI